MCFLKCARFLIFLVFLSRLTVTKSEVFSSIAVMENVVKIQGDALKLFDTYVETYKDDFKKVMQMIESFKSEYEKAQQSPEEYIGNPIDSYRILKQLFSDWKYIMLLLNQSFKDFEASFDTLKDDKYYPIMDDVVGSAVAIERLQNTYELDTKDLAEGIIKEIQYSSPLNWHDCLIIGMFISQETDYKNVSLEWQNLALEKYKPEEEYFYNKLQVMESIANTNFEMGNISFALKTYKDIQSYNPKHPNITKIIKYAEETQANPSQHTNNKNSNNLTDEEEGDQDERYKSLCRETLGVPNSEKKNFKCRYVSSHTAFSKLAPFRMEEHYHHPDIRVFHDVLYDEEIKFIINEIKPQLKRAMVLNSDGNGTADSVRVSMNSWLPDNYNKMIKRINQRFEDMTGLSMKYAESLQVADYGIGGYYDLHLDIALNDTVSSMTDELKNRTATILTYMTDVDKGGNTVFPFLGVSVRPKKGSAVFWHNLHLSGAGNYGLLHAACPVLKGHKWVLNKWVRLHGNEFLRPCSLIQQEEGYCRSYPELEETTKR